MVRFLLSAFAALLPIGCAHTTRPLATLEDVTRLLFGGSERQTALNSATQVDVFRIDPIPRFKGSRSDFVGPPYDSDPVAVPLPIRQELLRILNDPSTYSFGSTNNCPFWPQFEIRFVARSESLSVLVDLQCGMILVFDGREHVGTGQLDDEANAKLSAMLDSIFRREDGR